MIQKSLCRRFLRKFVVNKQTGCWDWIAGHNGAGYGYLRLGRATEGKILAHRLSYLIYVGDIPKHDSYHGICVLHKCDNRRCVNPKHLFLGTNSDNINDRVKKGRSSRKPVNPKLNVSQVKEIKEMIASGKTDHFLAGLFAVSHWTIKGIRYGKSWSDI